MPPPLLATKLYVPRPRPGVVARSRLSDQLGRGLQSKLTLVSAPAGFGKTTMVADWLATRGGDAAVAWLSLDPDDDDAASFWAYVIAALQVASPGLGQEARLLLDSPRSAADGALPSLLNELATIATEVVLVLDDYHVIEAAEIHAGVAFLLDHLPSQVHLVIVTRSDPPLPVARLRARRELVEIRAADLRFDEAEAAAYLEGSMGLSLAPGDVEALERRTEGWIAALQLAGLSLQGRTDGASFIAEFAGDDRYVVDYLVEEVLARQPEAIRAFLLETSILSRLSGPLCDAVTEQGSGRATLELLERRNLFVVPLDDRRRWYRYHHLFADVLRARLADERPDALPDLHRRASAWFEGAGEWFDSIHHAVQAGDTTRAADLIELAIPTVMRERGEAALLRWFDALPDGSFDDRPVLTLGYVGAGLRFGRTDRAAELLDRAERAVDASGRASEAGASSGIVVVDAAALERAPATIAMYRAALARIAGDTEATVVHARHALELAGDGDQLARGGAQALLGLAYWSGGDLAAAERWYADGMASLSRAGMRSDLVAGAITLADMDLVHGRLDEAVRRYEHGLSLALGEPGQPLRGAADMHVGIAAVLIERNDLDSAANHLAKSRALGSENGLPRHPYRTRLADARIRQALGDVEGAFVALDEAERRFFGDFAPDVRPVSAVRARLSITEGRLSEAAAWARDRGLAVSDDLAHVREFEHATLARLLVATGSRDAEAATLSDAVDLARRLRESAEEGGRAGSALDARIVEALALQAVGDRASAVRCLAAALDLAEPERYVRAFLDEGPPMIALLRHAARERGGHPYAQGLLAQAVTADATPADRGPGGVKRLVEPLSDREMEILRLLRSELDGPDIARELTVSLNTVRTHTRNIYAKLGVNNRRAAVRRAEELGLSS